MGSPRGPGAHGFPRLETVRSAITALYRRLAPEAVGGFTASVLPAEVAFDDQEDLTAGVQRIAQIMTRHLGLPDAPVTVSFRRMPEAAWVELTEGPEYTVELHPRFDGHRRDIGAVLAHEITHVFLHRAGLTFAGTQDNEILTDTTAAYLGVGWLLLDAFRLDALTSQRLGYLTPEEYGYVLAKRAARFGEDPRIWFTSPQAYDAYAEGLRLAEREAAEPPLAGSGWARRRRYTMRRELALRSPDTASQNGPYTFQPGPRPTVTFDCPRCHQRIRVPVQGRLRARCGLCRSVLECDT